VPRPLLTWLVVGGVVVVALTAAFDGIRRTGGSIEASAHASGARQARAAPTITRSGGPSPPCAGGDLHLAVSTSWPQPTVVVRNIARHPCHVSLLRLAVAVTDRHGRRLSVGPGSVALGGRLAGDLPAGADLFTRPRLYSLVRWCTGSGRPYVAWATVGPLAAHERFPCRVPGPNP